MGKSRNQWLLVTVGTLFVLYGFFSFYSIVGKTLFGYAMTASWIEVPARIVALQKNENIADDTSTYTISGLYTYQIDGVEYSNHRISVGAGSDRLGTYWPELHRQLQASMNTNEATAYVDVSNPNNAILDRTVRWESVLFALLYLAILGLSGAFVIWYSLAKATQLTQVSNRTVPISSCAIQTLGTHPLFAHMSITTDADCIYLDRKGYRNSNENLAMILFACFWMALGLYMLRTHWAGFLILLLGLSGCGVAIFGLVKTVEISIKKSTRDLEQVYRWCGRRYHCRSSPLSNPHQLWVKLTHCTSTREESGRGRFRTITNYYALKFDSENGTDELAINITDRKVAVLLKDAIVEQCFIDDSSMRLAA